MWTVVPVECPPSESDVCDPDECDNSLGLFVMLETRGVASIKQAQ